MKFNHLTVNTNHNVMHNANEVFSTPEVKHELKKIYMRIMSNNNKPVEVLDGIYARGIEESDAYSILLCDKNGMILLQTQGTINPNRQCELEEGIKNSHKASWKRDPKIDKLYAPIVYDLLFPTIILRVDITEWTGDFCKCMLSAYRGVNHSIRACGIHCSDKAVAASTRYRRIYLVLHDKLLGGNSIEIRTR